MLREHGAQRPSVFELLAQVHHVRGTNPRFTYHIVPQQPFPPRAPQSQSANQLDDLVSYRPSSSAITQRPPPAKNTGIQAREKVLEAIAPMRRGRPPSSQPVLSDTSKPPSPRKMPLETTKSPKVDLLDDHFGTEEDNAWRTVRNNAPSDDDIKASSSHNAGLSAWKPKSGARSEPDATWSVESLTSKVTDSDVRLPNSSFGDNFAENLWNAYDSNRAGPGTTSTTAEKAALSRIAPLEGSRTTKLVITKGKDAFEGLGLTSSTPPAPTLGEARKLRTGLASVNAYNRPAVLHSPSSTATKPKSTAVSIKPSPSPRPSLSHVSTSWKSSSAMKPISSSAASTTPAFSQIGDLFAETRFPSLEELDATMAYTQKPTRYTTRPDPNTGNQNIIDLSVPSTSSIPLRPQPQRTSTVAQNSTRSEQVTGTPVGEKGESSRALAGSATGEGISPVKRPSGRPPSRTSVPVKQVASKPLETQDLVDLTSDSISGSLAPQKTRDHKDWLMGDMNTFVSPARDRGPPNTSLPETPVLREFTNKRSSFVEENNIHISPQEAITGQQSTERVIRASTSPSPTRKNPRILRSVERKRGASLSSSYNIPTLPGRLAHVSSTHSLNVSQESPTSLAGRRPSFERSSSDNRNTKPVLESSRDGRMSSSDEESPEDAAGFVASKSTEKPSGPKHKRRQSSVHDLVDLWGGGVVQTRERRKDEVPNPSTDPPHDSVAKPHKNRSITVPSSTKLNTSSPQRLQAMNSGAIEVPRSPSRSPNRRSPSSHMKQMSAANSTSGTPTAPSRGRPQSLLVFPMSKSISEGKSDAPVTPSGLSVPQDGSRASGARRPSITDMVQRYEAIGKVSSPGSHSLPRSVMAPGASLTPTRGLQPSLHSPIASKLSPSRAAVSSEDPSSTIDTDKRQLPTNSRPDYTGSRDKPADAPRSQNPVSGLPIPSSSRLLSYSSSQGGVDGLPSAVVPAANGTTPPEEDGRSSSPEKPYQGVGKLIDQWQRKSEEASRSPGPRRGLTTRRAGLAGSGVGRDS